MTYRNLLFVLFTLAGQFVFGQNAARPPEEPTIYTCTMDPEVSSNKPGNCPKCGMKLVKKKTRALKQKPKTLDLQPQSRQNMPMETASKPKDEVPKDKFPKANETAMKFIEHNGPPKVVRYDLYLRDTTVNFTGKNKHAIAVNGSIPMPTLTFTEGDTAEIFVHNELDVASSLHWHGLFLPNQYDGVPYLTQMAIKAHSTHLYRFPIIQHGTHWYHSHSGLQEQIGMYGALILNKRKETAIPTLPLVLSEWTDMRPGEVNRSLHNATDWFAIKKGSTQSYSEAIRTGHLKTKMTNEWKRMNAMDVSDVYYNITIP